MANLSKAVKAVEPARQLTPEQEAIISWAHAQAGATKVAAIGEAVAGSGKSFIVKQIYKAMVPVIGANSIQVCVFNKHNKEDLGKQGIPASTIHGLGYRALANHNRVSLDKPDDHKYYGIVAEYFQTAFNDSAELSMFVHEFVKVLNFVRMTMTNPTDSQALINMISHYELDYDLEKYAKYLDSVIKILGMGWLALHNYGQMDYTDMLYWPIVNRMPVKRYQLLMVDEAQDLSAAQLMLARAHAANVEFYVGDRYQAIMGFAGADSNSLRNIETTTKAGLLPLTYSFRCPQSHAELAREIVPHFNVPDSAKDGDVYDVRTEHSYRYATPGTLVVCRLTAPLIEYAFKLARMHKRVFVRGRDIGAGLLAVAAKIQKRKDYRAEYFCDLVQEWAHTQLAKLKESEVNKATNIQDKADSLVLLFDYAAENNLSLEQAVSKIFSDYSSPDCVTLSTIHRAKGLQSDNVIFLRSELSPFPKVAAGTWQYQQEENMRYVALTRSTDNLILAEGEIK
jgi:superfamily I DNA/RNA helicase